MAQRPVIDTHPDKQKIVNAILAGLPLRKVAEMAGVSRQTVNVYRRKVLRPALQAAIKVRENQSVTNDVAQQVAETATLANHIATGDPLLSRLESRGPVIDRNIDRADKSSDFKGLSGLLRADRDHVELIARLTGRLDAPQQSTTNVFIALMPNAQQAQAPKPEPQIKGETYDVEIVDTPK